MPTLPVFDISQNERVPVEAYVVNVGYAAGRGSWRCYTVRPRVRSRCSPRCRHACEHPRLIFPTDRSSYDKRQVAVSSGSPTINVSQALVAQLDRASDYGSSRAERCADQQKRRSPLNEDVRIRCCTRDGESRAMNRCRTFDTLGDRLEHSESQASPDAAT
jgi:hypothetical protein